MTPFVQRAQTAQNALTRAVDPEPKTEKVRFYVTVTEAWLRQLILDLVLTFYRRKSARPIWQQLGNRTANARPMSPQFR
jgi:hypothetical protein